MKHMFRYLLFTLLLLMPDMLPAMTAVNITTSATAILPEAGSRTAIAIYNASDTTVYLGGSGVTTSIGFPVQPGQTLTLEGNSATDALYGIHGGSGSKEIRYEANAQYDAGPIAGDNLSVSLLASAARTTTQTSADIINHNGSMLRVGLDMTVVGTGSVTLSVQEKDANGIYRTLLTSAAITTNIYTALTIFPGSTVTANVSANDFVPRTFRIIVTANNANSATYSVAYSLN